MTATIPVALVVIFGQSNALGRAADTPYVATARRAYMWDYASDTIEGVADPIDQFSGFGAGSMGPRLAQALRDGGYEAVCILAAGQGGTHSNEFLPDVDPWNPATIFGAFLHAVDDALAALPAGSYLAGVIQYQGETDAAQETVTGYASRWETIYDTAQTELGAHPWLLVRCPVDKPSSANFAQEDWDELLAEQDDLATAIGQSQVQAPPGQQDEGVHQIVGADDTEGFRKLAVDSSAIIVAEEW